MTVRERLEREERAMLSPLAVCSGDSKGRQKPMPSCDLRTEFQRDRDRIIHCKSFRRLKHKTQCFLPDEGDHYRTRLTHTLEVAQVARTIARSLRLNEDLTEAIALGHDLGHACFGHAGERVLNKLCPGGFRHNEHSLRMVDVLERDGQGLNLTVEVRDGILEHRAQGKPATLEGQIVSLADRIAYISHDIDDAIRARVLREEDIPSALRTAMGGTHGQRISSMIHDVVESSVDQQSIGMSPTMWKHFSALRAFLFEVVYLREEAQREETKVQHLLGGLYAHYMENPEAMPHRYSDDDAQAVRDFLAGMTDRFAARTYRGLFLPRGYG